MKHLKSVKWLSIALALLVFGALFAYAIDTQFGTTKKQRVNFQDKAGYTISGFLYVPQNATEQTPAPAVVTAHGNNGYTAAMAAFDIELSRRGYVVLALEMEGHGRSEYVPDALGDGSYGGIAAAEYLLNLSFVNPTQLGGTGHSKGSNAAVGMAKAYPENVRAILLNGYISPSVTGGALDAAVTSTNVGINMSRYDECGQDLLHHLMGTEWNYDYLRNPTVAASLFSPMWGGAELKNHLNEGLGDWQSGTKRIFYTLEDCTHVTTVVSKTAVSNALEFFNTSMPAPSWISSENQVWSLRYWGGCIEIAGFVILLLSLGSLMLKMKFFQMLGAEASAPRQTLTGNRSPLYRTFFVLLFTIIPTITFIPCYVFGENQIKQSALFPFNPSAFGYLLWTVVNAIIMLLIFVVWHFSYGKNHGGNLQTYGLSFGKDKKFAMQYMVRAVIYSLVVIIVSYSALLILEQTTLIEAATPISSLRTFKLDRLVYFIQYFIPFFISFLIGNLAFSAILREDEGGTPTINNMIKNQVIGLLQAVGGLTVMYIIWNLAFIVSTKPVAFYRETPFVMGNVGFMCICFSLIPMFGINSLISTHFSVKTRRIFVGALICAIFIVWVTFSGQSLALPSTQSAVGLLAK